MNRSASSSAQQIVVTPGRRACPQTSRKRRAQIAELRHRRRAHCEDRIRAAKDTGLTNLPLHGFDQNRIWCAVV